MNTSEIKKNIEFYTDALFQKGYDLGWNSVLEELEQEADREWNLGNKTTSEVITRVARQIRKGQIYDVA